MKTVALRRAIAAAEQYAATLRTQSAPYHYLVLVEHRDGTRLSFHDAFYHRYCDPEGEQWWVIFAEHHGIHVYEVGEIRSIAQYRHIPNTLLMPGSSRAHCREIPA